MAFKIFELGLKKYGDIPEYILAYIDYLSHLNGTSPAHRWENDQVLWFIVKSKRGSEVSDFALLLPPGNRGQQHQGSV